MKDDEIVILGKNADAYANNQTSDSFDRKLIRDARFAQLVAAAEREACANFLQEQCKGVLSMQANVVRDCVDALRRRAAAIDKATGCADSSQASARNW